jgi:hypothetical protein
VFQTGMVGYPESLTHLLLQNWPYHTRLGCHVLLTNQIEIWWHSNDCIPPLHGLVDISILSRVVIILILTGIEFTFFFFH